MMTNLGYCVTTVHPMADAGYRYRLTVIGTLTHVDEYVARVGAWVYLGCY